MDALIGYPQIIIPILAVIFVWRYVVLLAKRISLILCLRRYGEKNIISPHPKRARAVCGYTLASASSLAGSLDCASRGSAI